ncbi:MAG: GtrA family protein [bacterium]|nr:GtrA family protein [bacterium]
MKHWIFGRVTSRRIEFFRYVFVGASAAVINILAYAIFTEVLGMHYLLAAVIGYCLGFVWNYVVSIVWVFSRKHSRSKEITILAFITLGGLLWTELILYLFVEFADLNHLFALFITLWIVLLWNFGMRKLYVFH